MTSELKGVQTENIYDTAIKQINHMKVNLLKECYEYLGIDFGETKNNIVYHNYLAEDNLEFVGGNGLDSVDAMISSGETKANGEAVIRSLMNDMGLTKEQAAGIAGVMTAESGVNPHIVNKGEKAGTYKSSGANNEGTPYGTKHSPWSYGAGICQWTFTDRKEKAIMGGLGVSRDEAIRIIKGGGIESLSLDQQIKMLEYELNTSYKYTLQGLRKCSNASQAAATFYCHAVAGYSTSTEPASQAEIDKKNAAYSKVGANSQINKGMAFAEGYVA